MVEIYTDGSSRGNPGPGGWGVIILSDARVMEYGGREEATTNNRMEMMAVIMGLRQARAKSARQVTVYSDSQYVIKGITEWIVGWQKNNWKNSQKKDVLNRDLWERMVIEKDGLDVEFKHVKGHSGHSLNERADEIATMFADNKPTILYDGEKVFYNHA